MCRMIAAGGDVRPEALRAALLGMASNSNPRHTHEQRGYGAGYLHEDGWGAAWVDGGKLRVSRSPLSCLNDPSLAEVDRLRTNLVFLHARRASPRGTVRVENSHPFFLEEGGKSWAFCHNGVVNDKSTLRPKPGLRALGGTDSEMLFLHILGSIDPEDPAASLLPALETITEYTALHSFLATQNRIFVVAKRHPWKGRPEYHALWEGRGPRIHVVSSEPVDGVGVEPGDWRRLPEPGIVTIAPA